MKLLKDRKGFVYFVEIALSVLILLYIFAGFIESNQVSFEQKQLDNLRMQGWGAMDVLHEFGILDPAVKSGSFGKIELYTKYSFLDTTGLDLEFYNQSLCYPIDSGVLGTGAAYCNSINAPTNHNIVSTYYTLQDNMTTSSLRVYLWSKL